MSAILHYEIQHSRGKETAATPTEAMLKASRHIAITSRQRDYCLKQLNAGYTTGIAYGFTDVMIVPIWDDHR